MIKIINREKLIGNGETSEIRRGRDIALQCLEQAVNAVEPTRLIKATVKVKNDQLQVEGYTFDLGKFKHIYVVGGGKAGAKMAQAIEEILGKYVTAGVVNIPYGTSQKTNVIELNEASHPVPDEAGVAGTFRIMALAEQAKKDDLVICLISGGGSSLMPLPHEGISLKDKQALTNALLKSGAAITEINAVRKHLSDFKGGWLGKKLTQQRSSTLYSQMSWATHLIQSPLVQQFRTLQHSVMPKKSLKKYSLWLYAPVSVRKTLSEGAKGLLQETPKRTIVFEKVSQFGQIGNNRTADRAAAMNV